MCVSSSPNNQPSLGSSDASGRPGEGRFVQVSPLNALHVTEIFTAKERGKLKVGEGEGLLEATDHGKLRNPDAGGRLGDSVFDSLSCYTKH